MHAFRKTILRNSFPPNNDQSKQAKSGICYIQDIKQYCVKFSFKTSHVMCVFLLGVIFSFRCQNALNAGFDYTLKIVESIVDKVYGAGNSRF